MSATLLIIVILHCISWGLGMWGYYHFKDYDFWSWEIKDLFE